MRDLDADKHLLIKTIHYCGDSSFDEYADYLRFEYLKILARHNPDTPAEELMLRSGLTPQSAFYRHRRAKIRHFSGKKFSKILSGI